MAIKLEGVIQIVMIHAVSKMIFVPESMTRSVMSIVFITVIKSVAMLMIKSVVVAMIEAVAMSMIKVVRLSLGIIVSFIVAQRVAPITMMTIEALRTMIKS